MELTTRQEQVLQRIQSHPKITLQEVAKEIGVTRQRVHQVVSGLIEKGLIDPESRIVPPIIRTYQPEAERINLYVTHRGEQNHGAKLDDAKVRVIRYLYAVERWGTRDIGNRYGVHSTTIRAIIKGRTWKHVQ